MQKKKLDELFQEKFLDFKEAPDNKVWQTIDASLGKKRKKRIIPIWWQLSGIAAALAIVFLLFNPFSDTQTTNEILVDTNNKAEQNNDIQTKSTNKNFVDSLKTNNDALVQKKVNEIIKIREEDTSEDKIQEVAIKAKKNEIIVTKEKWDQKKNAVVENKIDKEKPYSNNNLIAETNSSVNTLSDKTHANTSFKKGDVNNTVITSNKGLNTNKQNSINTEEETILAKNETVKENLEATDDGKKSIFEEIADQEEEMQITAINNRWSAGPNIAPVYFNGHGKGSPVNSIFVPNSKSGNINLSYGVSVAYTVSKKLTIRSGVNKVDYGYDTEDVAFSSSLNSISSNGQLATIDYAETSNTLTISSKKVTSEKFSTANNSLDVSAKSATREGFMSQQLGYIEVPVEVNYTLSDKKFGINLIGGLSSLFLVDNAVSLTAGELTTEVGEANNINDVNFSANMGLGFNYKFSSKVQFNLEPIFKYQLNTFSEIDGTFRPYSIGVYSGLSFKF